tara:strand:+ start:953 stop:2161 length:1209 start_codon:yes stop_codon:yes gene_type:complete
MAATECVGLAEQQDFAVVGLDVIDWDGPWMNRQQILTRLAKQHRVVYSRGSFFLWDRFTGPWRAAPLFSSFIEKHGVQVHQRSKLQLRAPRIPEVDRLVIKRIGRNLRKKALAGQSGPLVSYVFNPAFYRVGKAVNADLLVYHAYDQFSAYPHATEDEVHYEKKLVQEADLVIASSATIANTLLEYCDRPVEVIPNGADYERFAGKESGPGPVPEDLAAIAGPRITYFGNLTEKVDTDLIARLAEARPDWSFVFVGGVLINAGKGNEVLRRLEAMPNVHFLGHKTYDEVAGYYRHSDVNLLAYRMGEGLWSEGCSPLKLYEYLATGKPVVSARLQVVEDHEDVLAVASTDEEWLAAIEDAVTNGGVGSKASRQAEARKNTWEVRVAAIEALIHKALQAKQNA